MDQMQKDRAAAILVVILGLAGCAGQTNVSDDPAFRGFVPGHVYVLKRDSCISLWGPWHNGGGLHSPEQVPPERWLANPNAYRGAGIKGVVKSGTRIQVDQVIVQGNIDAAWVSNKCRILTGEFRGEEVSLLDLATFLPQRAYWSGSSWPVPTPNPKFLEDIGTGQ
jgi:hypothetical protein